MNSGAQSKSWILMLVLVALAATAIAGCGGGASTGGGSSGPKESGGTLNVGLAEEVITLDPLEAYSASDINVTSQINEPLWREDLNGKIVPWLVDKAVPSDGQRTWTLRLKPGVKFSDGKAMTSADVLFSLERARGNEAWESLTGGITKVAAPSASTVKITSSEPAPELPAILSTWIFGIVPKNLEGKSEKEFFQHPIGTGPFEFVSWKHGESITLARNPHYWQQGKPYLETVVWHAVTSPESRLSQLRSGQLDAIYSPSSSQFEAIESAPETEIGEYPEGYIEMLQLNSKNPLFKDKRVREAITMALDREGMIQAVLLGHGTPAGSFLPPAQPFHDPSIPAPEQNIEKAKGLLAEAVADGAPSPSMTILVPTEDDFWSTASQIAQQNLEEVGFKVKLQPMESSSWFEVLASGKFDATFAFGYSQTSSPAEMLGFYNGFNGFNTFVDTTETTELLAKALRTVNLEARTQIYNELQEVIWKEGYLVTVVNKPYSWAHRTDVDGFYVGVVGIPWLTEASLTS